MRGAIPPLSKYVFMAWCLVQQRDNFTFAFTFTFNMNAYLVVYAVISRPSALLASNGFSVMFRMLKNSVILLIITHDNLKLHVTLILLCLIEGH
jgi:hypothetical protein